MRLTKSSVDNAIGTIGFNNAAKRNSLSDDLINEVVSTLDLFQAGGVRVVVLRALDKPKVWSAGRAINELPKADQDPLPYADMLEKMLRAVRHYPGAVIAMVHGSVWGGACDLVLNCDIVVADPTAQFAVTPARLGLPYSETGIQYFIARLPINAVNELIMTANPMPAERALNFGILNHLVPEEDLEQVTYGLAGEIRSRSAASIAVYKEQARIMIEAVALTAQQAQRIQQLRHDVFTGPDYTEGLTAFLEKRTPDFN